LERELQDLRQKKIEQEFQHQQRINDFETSKAAILSDNENLKKNLNNKIDDLTTRLSSQQRSALETELNSNAAKKSKEDTLTGKIHQFSNIESDFSKQIHCKDAEIAYLQHMNK
jgi:predicted solute-binding protein